MSPSECKSGTKAYVNGLGLLPRGKAQVKAVFGGMDVANPDTGNVVVIASAAVEAFLPKQA